MSVSSSIYCLGHVSELFVTLNEIYEAGVCVRVYWRNKLSNLKKKHRLAVVQRPSYEHTALFTFSPAHTIPFTSVLLMT